MRDITGEKMRLLGVSGSMREASYGLKALQLVLQDAQAQGAATRVLDLRTTALPMFQPDAIDAGPGPALAREAVEWAHGIIVVTPDYHGSMSGAVKNFFDYHWAEFAGKLFGYICMSHEKGLTAMDQMRTAVRQCYGWSLPYGVSIHGESDFSEAGLIINQNLHQRLRILARDMAIYGRLIHDQFTRDQHDPDAASFAGKYRTKRQ